MTTVCDFCGIEVDSIDGVTDGFVVACGNYLGNGCEKYVIESEEKPYRFGDFNPSVSTRAYTGRGGHETWGTQR